MDTLTLPIRIELRTSTTNVCLTISDDFILKPTAGDFLILGDDAEPLALSIKAVIHYVNQPSVLVLTNPIDHGCYDDILKTIDWFKSRYEIIDIQSQEKPEPYYVLYRTIVHLLDIKDDVPIVKYDPDHVKMLAETCRVILIADMQKDKMPLRGEIVEALSSTNGQVETFHRLVFGQRRQDRNGPELRQILKEWDGKVNPNRLFTWNVDDDLCRFIGGIVFSRLKCEKPYFLRINL